ncbi:MAG TPA: hypothetical protein VNS55_04095 [Nocardioides sp.]|nr:hypothetical protein [Nocardioides sp.]
MNLTSLLGAPLLPASFPLPLDQPFTYRTALREAGLTSRDLQWLVANGFLRRALRGVYVASHLPDTIALRCACLRLAVPPDAVITDRHAGWVHGAEMVLAPNEHLDLATIRTFLPAGRGRLRNPLSDSGERTFRPDDVMEIDGLRVTTPLRTAWDLGRVRWPERSLASLDQMLRLRAFSKEELTDGVERFRGMRWVRTLRAIAPLADGRAESPPESVLRLRWIEALLPAPVPQLEVWHLGELLARLDLGNEDARYGAEFDGMEWHSSPEQQAHDRQRRAACEEHEGWLIDVFVKENLYGRTANAERMLREGMAEARRRLGRRP